MLQVPHVAVIVVVPLVRVVAAVRETGRGESLLNALALGALVLAVAGTVREGFAVSANDDGAELEGIQNIFAAAELAVGALDLTEVAARDMCHPPQQHGLELLVQLAGLDVAQILQRVVARVDEVNARADGLVEQLVLVATREHKVLQIEQLATCHANVLELGDLRVELRIERLNINEGLARHLLQELLVEDGDWIGLKVPLEDDARGDHVLVVLVARGAEVLAAVLAVAHTLGHVTCHTCQFQSVTPRSVTHQCASAAVCHSPRTEIPAARAPHSWRACRAGSSASASWAAATAS